MWKRKPPKRLNYTSAHKEILKLALLTTLLTGLVLPALLLTALLTALVLSTLLLLATLLTPLVLLASLSWGCSDLDCSWTLAFNLRVNFHS